MTHNGFALAWYKLENYALAPVSFSWASNFRVNVAGASSMVLGVLAFATAATAQDLLDYTTPLILSRPLPQGVTFSNFAGEVYVRSEGDEPANQQVAAGMLRDKQGNWYNYITPNGSSCGTYVWDALDNDVLTTHSQGQEYLMDLAYTAQCSWNNAVCNNDSSKCPRYPPANESDWTNFVSAVVARYSVAPFNVKYFQIWNEPGDVCQKCQVLDWLGTMNQFLDDIYNPAATIIHNSGGQVVFSGWACDTGNSNWTTCEDDLNYWLNHTSPNYPPTWQNTDYIDVHYAPLSVWQFLYPAWIASGKVKGLWQSEIGGTDPSPIPGELTPTYLTAMYWALSSGGWNPSNPDRYKFFWFPGCMGASTPGCLTSAPAALTTTTQAGPLAVLSPQGAYHAVLANVLGGGTLGAYSNYTSNFPAYPALNGSVGFTVGRNRIVVAVFPSSANSSIDISVPLTAQARSVTFTDASGKCVFTDASGKCVPNFYSQSGGVLNVTGNLGAPLSTAYLLNIQF
jgi:hypothetical protein